MATHSSTLAWRIPWTEEPGRLQTKWSQSQTRLSNFSFSFFSGVWSPPANAGDKGLTPGPGRSHRLQSN